MDNFELEKMRWAPRSTPSKGPRRLCKFCLLAVLFPILLLCIPLYMRFLALRPHSLILSPTDMKLLNQESTVSTAWCKSQRLRMNSSFHAYLFSEKPKITSEKKRVSIRKEMVIQDDMKKYWGFYLLKGSTVRLGGCARWPGSSVVVVRGPEEAARCAWLGELDSQEESDEFSNEFDIQNDREDDFTHYNADFTTTEAGLDTTEEPSSTWAGTSSNSNTQDMSNLLKILQNLPQDQKNILLRQLQTDQTAKPDRTKRNIELSKADLLKNDLNRDEDDFDVGGEDLSEEEETDNDGTVTPDHLMDTGIFDQKNRANNKPENSHEEVRSSDSSSEEALRNCKGVIVSHEFMPHKKCNSKHGNPDEVLEWYPFRNDSTSELLHVHHTGFYFFIFSNENEMTNNTVIADIELQKTRFNTSKSEDACNNSTDCELHLKFWSNQHVLVEVPEYEDSPECESVGYNNFAKCNYIVRAESECRPRGTVYLIFLLLVPVIILLFAYI